MTDASAAGVSLVASLLIVLSVVTGPVLAGTGGTATTPAHDRSPSALQAAHADALLEPTASQSAPNAPTSPLSTPSTQPTAVVTAETIPNTPGEVRVTVTYENVSPSDGLKIALPCASSCSNEDANRSLNKGATLESSDGFRTASASKWDLELDPSSSDGTASVTYRVGGNLTSTNRRTAVDTGEWAWVPLWAMAPAADRPVDTIGRSKGDIYSERYLVAGEVPVRRETIHGQRARFVMHPEQSFPRIARAYSRTLRNVSYDLRVGGRDANLTVWMTWGNGGSGNELVTNGLGNRDGLVHEYFHTRQEYVHPSSNEMCDDVAASEGCATWFIENPPELYQELYGPRVGKTARIPGPTPDELAADTRHDPPLDHLAHPTKSGRAKRTLLALDRLIRTETGGNRTVQHLLRRLNHHARHRGTLNHSVFERELAAVTGSPQSSFVRQYIEARNATVPNSTLPPESRLTDPLWNGSGDGHWNTSLALSADPIPPGTDQVRFTLTNTGTDPSIGHTTSLQPAAPWRIESATPERGVYNSSNDTWRVPDLSAGESTTLTVTLASPRYDHSVLNITARVTDSDGNVDTASAEGVNLSNPQVPGTTPGVTLSNLQVHSRSPRAGDTVPITAEVRPTGPSWPFEAVVLADGRVVDRKTVRFTRFQTVAFGPSFPTPGDRGVSVALRNRSGAVEATVPPETVVVRNASVPVAVEPQQKSAPPGETRTFNLTVAGVPNGVGRYAVDLAVNDSSVANITDLAVVGGSGTTQTRANGERATMDASDLHTGNGTVTVARVNLTGRQVGWANLSVSVGTLGDTDGNGYDVTSTEAADFHVEPPGAPSESPGYPLPPDRIEGLACPDEVCESPWLAETQAEELALVSVGTDDGVQHYRAHVEDDRVVTFRPIEDPAAVEATVTVRTDATTVRSIRTADDPVARLRQAVLAGDIVVERTGSDPEPGASAETATLQDARAFVTGVISTLDEALDDLLGISIDPFGPVDDPAR